MKTNKLILVVILATLTSSCIAVKKFKSEDLPVHNTLRDTTVLVKDSIQNFSWKDIFVDTTLQTLIEEAIVGNEDIQIATENLYQSSQYLKSSNWAYAPSLSAVVTSGYNRLNIPKEQVFAGGNVSWEPDIWGKITAQKRAAAASISRDLAALRSVQSMVVAQTASLYYQLLALDEQLVITEDFIKLSTKTLQTMQLMRDNGMANSASVEQTKAQMFSAMSSLAEIKNAIYSTECAICLLIGRDAGSIKRSEKFELPNNEFVSKGFPLYLVQNRPDVKVAEYNLVQMFNISQSSKAAMYPSFKFSLDLGAAGASMYNPTAFALNFLGSLTAPIFNGRALRTQYKVNNSKQRQALVRFENLLQQAGSEISESLYSYANLNTKVEMRKQEVESNRKSVDYTQQLLTNGKVTYLEVLSAQSNFLNSSLNLIKDKLSKENSFINLYKALGGGWE